MLTIFNQVANLDRNSIFTYAEPIKPKCRVAEITSLG